MEKERLAHRKVESQVNAVQNQKNALENLFVDSVEEVKKQIMKRKLKTEIYNHKKF